MRAIRHKPPHKTTEEILKAVDPNVTRSATAYRQDQRILTLSTITVIHRIVFTWQETKAGRTLPGIKLSL